MSSSEVMTINNLKEFKDKEMTTLDVARITGKEHKHVIRDFNIILKQLDKSQSPNLDSEIYYKESVYQGKRRKEKCYILTKRGQNQILGSYSAVYRDLLFDYILYLEKENKKLHNQKIQLINARDEGKYDRSKFTDCLQDLKNYADEYRIKYEGKGQYKNIYSNYTNAIKEAIKTQVKRDDNNLEELKSIAQLENGCVKCIRKAMKENIHYKQIYILFKQDLQDILMYG